VNKPLLYPFAEILQLYPPQIRAELEDNALTNQRIQVLGLLLVPVHETEPWPSRPKTISIQTNSRKQVHRLITRFID
jgi:hypothetical protein